MYHEFQAVTEGVAITNTLLLAEHVLLWDFRDRMPITARYTLGTAAIGVGVTWAALRRDDPRAAIAFWCIAGMGGALVVAAHWLRAIHEQPADRLIRKAQKHGLWRTAP